METDDSRVRTLLGEGILRGRVDFCQSGDRGGIGMVAAGWKDAAEGRARCDQGWR